MVYFVHQRKGDGVMTELERMLSGRLYDAGDEALAAARDRAKKLTWHYNQMDPTDWIGRTVLLRELLGHLGEDSWIEPSFRCDYGTHITLGDHVFINYDCIFLDVARITIGDRVLIGPRTGHCRTSHRAGGPGHRPGIRPAYHPGGQRLAGRECGGLSRRDHRPEQHHCRGLRGDKEHPAQRHRRRDPLPRPASHHRR